MTEQEMLDEIRSLRNAVGTLGDQVISIRYEDLKDVFIDQMKMAMGEEGRRSFRVETMMLRTSSACLNRSDCLAHLSETVDAAVESFMAGDMEGAERLLDGLEEVVSGDRSPCMDGNCSREAGETLRRVRAILTIYEGLAARLGSHPGIAAVGKMDEITPERTEAALTPLANAWRIKILRVLRQGDRSLTEIGRAVHLRTGHLQFHLRALMEGDYVAADRRRHLYSITSQGTLALQGAEDLVSRIAAIQDGPGEHTG